MRILVCFILAFSTSAFACNYSLQVKSSSDIDSSREVIAKVLESEIESLGYYKKIGNFSIKSTISITRDHHNPKLYHSKTSVSLYKYGNMENYVQGFGDHMNSKSKAMSLKQITKAIKAAISNLPYCNQ